MFKKKLKLRSFKEAVDVDTKNTNGKNDGPSYYPETKRGREFFDAHTKTSPVIDKTGSPETQFRSNLKKIDDHGPPKVDSFAGDPHSNSAIAAVRSAMLPRVKTVKEAISDIHQAEKPALKRKTDSFDKLHRPAKTEAPSNYARLDKALSNVSKKLTKEETEIEEEKTPHYKDAVRKTRKEKGNAAARDHAHTSQWSRKESKRSFDTDDNRPVTKPPYGSSLRKEEVEFTKEEFEQLDEGVRMEHCKRHHARAVVAAQEALQHLNTHGKQLNDPKFDPNHYYDDYQIKEVANQLENSALSIGTHVENRQRQIDMRNKENSPRVMEAVNEQYVSSSRTIRELLRKK